MKKLIIPITLLIILLLWSILSLVSDSSLILPSPWSVAVSLGGLFADGEFWWSVVVTIFRAVVSFALAVTLSALLVMWSSVSSVAKSVIGVVVAILRSVPTMSILLIALIVVKSSGVPLVISFLVSFPLVYSNFLAKVESRQDIQNMCKVFGVSKWNYSTRVVLPCVVSQFPHQLSSVFPLCVKTVIAGEALALPMFGIGREMYIDKINLNVETLVAWTIVACVICFAVECIAGSWEKKQLCK